MVTDEPQEAFPSSDDVLPTDGLPFDHWSPTEVSSSSSALLWSSFPYGAAQTQSTCLLLAYFLYPTAWRAPVTPSSLLHIQMKQHRSIDRPLGFWFCSTLIHFLLDCCNFLSEANLIVISLLQCLYSSFLSPWDYTNLWSGPCLSLHVYIYHFPVLIHHFWARKQNKKDSLFLHWYALSVWSVPSTYLVLAHHSARC